MQCVNRNSNDLFVDSSLVLHQQCSHRATSNNRAGNYRNRSDNKNVAWITVLCEGLRNEAIIAGIEHCSMEKSVYKHRARLFVEFVFDRNASNRNLN